jgi:hypothetical protein
MTNNSGLPVDAGSGDGQPLATLFPGSSFKGFDGEEGISTGQVLLPGNGDFFATLVDDPSGDRGLIFVGQQDINLVRPFFQQPHRDPLLGAGYGTCFMAHTPGVPPPITWALSRPFAISRFSLVTHYPPIACPRKPDPPQIFFSGPHGGGYLAPGA